MSGRPLLAAGLALLGVLAVGACSSSGSTPASSTTGAQGQGTSTGSADPSGSPSLGSTPDPSDYASLYASPSPATVLGSATGKIRNGAPAVEITLDVLSVLAEPGNTVVRLRLSTPNPTKAPGTPYGMSGPHERAPDIGGVAMIAPQVGQRYLPATFRVPGQPDSICLCSWIPSQLGPDGVELSLVYPVLPATVTSVQIVLPDIPPVTAAVTRG